MHGEKTYAYVNVVTWRTSRRFAVPVAVALLRLSGAQQLLWGRPSAAGREGCDSRWAPAPVKGSLALLAHGGCPWIESGVARGKGGQEFTRFGVLVFLLGAARVRVRRSTMVQVIYRVVKWPVKFANFGWKSGSGHCHLLTNSGRRTCLLGVGLLQHLWTRVENQFIVPEALCIGGCRLLRWLHHCHLLYVCCLRTAKIFIGDGGGNREGLLGEEDGPILVHLLGRGYLLPGGSVREVEGGGGEALEVWTFFGWQEFEGPSPVGREGKRLLRLVGRQGRSES